MLDYVIATRDEMIQSGQDAIVYDQYLLKLWLFQSFLEYILLIVSAIYVQLCLWVQSFYRFCMKSMKMLYQAVSV